MKCRIERHFIRSSLYAKVPAYRYPQWQWIDTVNSEIFARVYIRETSQFREIKSSRNGKITLSFTDIGKSYLSLNFLTSQICLLTLLAKIKFLRKFPNLQYCLGTNTMLFFLATFIDPFDSHISKQLAPMIQTGSKLHPWEQTVLHLQEFV